MRADHGIGKLLTFENSSGLESNPGHHIAEHIVSYTFCSAVFREDYIASYAICVGYAVLANMHMQ
jgi:hypothetical protein